MGMATGTKILLASISPVALAVGWAVLDPGPGHQPTPEPAPKPKEPPSPEVLARVQANQERIEADRVAREGHAKVMEERRRLTPRFQAAEAKRARKAARRLELNNA